MDLFPDGGFVRLRSRARRHKYVYADEDASGVSLRPLGDVPSLNAVWKAKMWPVEGVNFLLLQGAAYGRYLAVSNEHERAPSGHLGLRAVQRDYNFRHVDPSFMWIADSVEDGQNYVRLRNFRRCLRANGRHRHWNNAITVDIWNGNRTTMMQWEVEAVPSTPVPLPLPPPPQPPIHARLGLFRRRTGHDVHHQGQRIQHVRTDDDGNYVNEDSPEFVFHDNSVSNLRTQVALERLVNQENITVRVWTGRNASVLPLVTNLPRDEDLMYIIVIPTETLDMDASLAMHGVPISSLAAESQLLPREGTQCMICSRRCDQAICRCCIRQTKKKLLDIGKTVDKEINNDLMSYCLDCHELVKKNHHHFHEGRIVPFDWYEDQLVAWVTGKEKWAAIFQGIQSDRCFHIDVGRPFLIYQQEEANRCKVCNDVLAFELLYGSLISFCCLQCWLKSGIGGTEPPARVAEAVLAAEFSNDIDTICLTCCCAFSRSCELERHSEHDWLAVITDNFGQSWIQIPSSSHHLACAWRPIKGLGASVTGEILIKDDKSQRCQNCRARLVDGGGNYCCLECSLSQRDLLPRPLLTR